MRTDDFRLRPATAADSTFLRDLFVACRAPELARSGCSAAELAVLLDLQVRARELDYGRRHPDAICEVIEKGDVPVGRVLVAVSATDVVVVDLAVAPAERRQGAATAALERWITEADDTRRSMTLQVAHGNPAIRLYERLGFSRVATTPVGAQLLRSAREVLDA